MLQKLNQKNSRGEDLYQQVKYLDKKKEFGSIGTLSELMKEQIPSKRKKHHKH